MHATRKEDRRLSAALLAAALAHTPEAEEALRGARTRMARKPAALARELLRNFPKGRRSAKRRRTRKPAAEGGARAVAVVAGAPTTVGEDAELDVVELEEVADLDDGELVALEATEADDDDTDDDDTDEFDDHELDLDDPDDLDDIDDADDEIDDPDDVEDSDDDVRDEADDAGHSNDSAGNPKRDGELQLELSFADLDEHEPPDGELHAGLDAA